MDAKEYFEKVMQDYNQHRNGRSLRKYCTDEAIDYDWLIKFKKTYPVIPPKLKVLMDYQKLSFLTDRVYGICPKV